jgi:hypothetical protein
MRRLGCTSGKGQSKHLVMCNPQGGYTSHGLNRGWWLQVGTLSVNGGYELMSLPGLIGLQRVDNLTITSPIMRNVTWLPGLSCSRHLSITSESMQSLEGLSQLQAVVPAGEGPGLQLTSMTSLTGRGVGSLRQYGACTPDNSSPWTSRILVTTYVIGHPYYGLVESSSVFTVVAPSPLA